MFFILYHIFQIRNITGTMHIRDKKIPANQIIGGLGDIIQEQTIRQAIVLFCIA